MSLVARNVQQIDAAFSELETIYILVGFRGEEIKAALEKLDTRVPLEFITVPGHLLDVGLSGGFAAIAGIVEPGELFVAVLGDEFYGGDDHPLMAQFIRDHPSMAGCCAYKYAVTPEEYFKNYAVVVNEHGVISKVIEKPKEKISPHYGLGLFVARGSLCALAAEKIERKEDANLIDLLNLLPEKENALLLGFEFNDIYVNVNTPSDVYHCLRLVRSKTSHTIDIIVPAWNEADSIAYVIQDFQPFCNSIIVMDNVSPDGTAEVARKAGATVYSEPLKGYGDAIKKGLDRSSADILVIVEADGTFRAKDLEKILTYLNDADAVIGSRTHWQYVEYGANMDFLQRMANLSYGFLITGLWWNRKSRFTDVGCSYRAIWQNTYKSISDRLKATGPEFAPEFVIELLQGWHRVIEVPVPYHCRILGESKFSGSFFLLARTALKMLRLILRKRIQSWFQNLTILIRGKLG